MILKKGLLILSSVSICIVALIYGASPQWFFQTFLADSQTPTIDQAHILRGIMMLYITLGLFWSYCAFTDKFRDAGIIVLALCCGGTSAGRVLSIIIDGLPSPILILFLLMELILVPVCIWLLRRKD